MTSMRFGGWMSRFTTRGCVAMAVVLVLAVAVASCTPMLAQPEAPGDGEGDPTTPTTERVSVRLSDLTPSPSPGKVVLFDYEGPEFEEDDLSIELGGDPIEGVFLVDQISVLLPLTHQGSTPLAFDFGNGTSANLVLEIGAPPSISNPEEYVAEVTGTLTTQISGLAQSDATYQSVYEALVDAQSGQVDLTDQEVHKFAVFLKQNVEPWIGSGSATESTSGRPVASSTSTRSRHEANCALSMKLHVAAVIVAVAATGVAVAVAKFNVFSGGLTTKELVVVVVAAILAIGASQHTTGEVIDSCLTAAVNQISVDLGSNNSVLRESEIQSPPWSVHAASRTPGRTGVHVEPQASSLERITFDHGQSRALAITLTYALESSVRSEFVGSMVKMRALITDLKDWVGRLTKRFADSFDTLIARFPESVARTETAAASGFELKGISDGNIVGEIASASGTTLSLRFTFRDPSSISVEYVDFDFFLANDDAGLDDTLVPARLVSVVSECDVARWPSRINGKPWEDATVGDVEACLAAGANVNAQNNRGNTPLYYRGDTPLHYAASAGNPEVVRALIAAGANVNAQNNRDYTPLHHAASVVNPKVVGYPEVVRVLIAAGANVNAQNDRDHTPLHHAAAVGNPEVVRALIAAGANVNAQDHTGTTPLHNAAAVGNPEVVRALIAAGADVNARRHHDGETPLLHVTNYGFRYPSGVLDFVRTLEVVRALIAAGADVNAQNDEGETPLHHATFDDIRLPVSAESDRVRPWLEVIRVLIAAGADVNARENYGITPLHQVAFYDRPDVIRALIAAGANVNAQNDGGCTPLDRAVWQGNNGTYRVLRSAGGVGYCTCSEERRPCVPWGSSNP